MSSILKKAVSFTLQIAVVVGAVLTLLIAVVPQGRDGLNTALLILDVLEDSYSPRALFGPQVQRYRVHYETSTGGSVAEIYRVPADRLRPAVVLSLGVTQEGFDHPHAVTLGNALARAGIVVMYHWPAEMSYEFSLDPREIDSIVSAYLYLEQQEYVDPDRIGLGGFCVGGSFALVAAADPRILDRVGLVSAFGPYFNGEDIVLQAVSNTAMYRGRATPWQPDPDTMAVITNELLETVAGTPDAAVLAGAVKGEVPVGAGDSTMLSPAGRAVGSLLKGVSYEEAKILFDALPVEFRRELDSISPSSVVNQVRSQILILHTRSDNVIPVAESLRLEEAFRARVKVRFTEVVDFEHTRPAQGGVPTRLRQLVQLYSHMYEIVRAAS